MYAHPHRQPVQAPAAARNAAGRLRRIAGVLAAATCGLLASAAIVPAAFAMVVPGGGNGGTGTAQPNYQIVRVIAGGMAGWQITLIALGAALLTAAVALFLDRIRAARRAATATIA
jgi:hypothetical protein